MPSIRSTIHKIVPSKFRSSKDNDPKDDDSKDNDLAQNSSPQHGETSDPPPSEQASTQDPSKSSNNHDTSNPAQQESLDLDTPFKIPSPAVTDAADAGSQLAADKAALAELVASYGSSSATAWLEFSRYHIWRPDSAHPISESSFPPCAGLPSLELHLRPVWLCVDGAMERVLGKDSSFGWSTLSCIVEDVVEPSKIVEIAEHDAGGSSTIKDLKKNLRRAQRAHVVVKEMKPDDWTDDKKKEVEDGVQAWKKSRSGIQIASSQTSFEPWLDFEHRRYWVAEQEEKIVGLLILAPIHPSSFQIKNAVSFPSAPRGTSEELIYRAMRDLDDAEHGDPRLAGARAEQEQSGVLLFHKPEGNVQASEENSRGSPVSHGSGDHSSTSSVSRGSRPSSESLSPVPTSDDGEGRFSHMTVTFGISAADTLKPVDNLSGWRITWLSRTYNKIVGGTGLLRRGDFRVCCFPIFVAEAGLIDVGVQNKFKSQHMPMYVCYPAEDGFGLDGANALLRCLRQ
ncbi:hypothetical protein EWM64_g6172 [Hericium alpestre]|uniref:Phosphatidylglycerol lysyltransferase C-terminal domain-containing protein n=1 Tax=Hericium alpestre TaxID=135208 RepID=A0A4Y9ZSR3_9AGAM|nr:hypothetical protein EWM64_g6172 [Hericium alpestre]